MLTKILKQTILKQQNRRSFFYWINLISNRLDEDRLKDFGPDRVCAEWLLRNGAAIKWKNNNEFLNDYNKLPNEDLKFFIKEIDATDSSIMYNGFEHFRDCKFIERLILHKCYYLEDRALSELKYLVNSLKFLQVSTCLNITDKGLENLIILKNLKELIIFDLPYIKNKDLVLKMLQNSLPQCKIEYNK